LAELIGRINWVDIIALILLVKISYDSSYIGVGRQILPLFLLLAILAVSFYYYKDVAIFLSNKLSINKSFSISFCYSLLVLILSICYHMILRLIRIFLPMPRPDAETGNIERTGGTIVGFVRGIIIVGIIFTVFLLAPIEFLEKGVTSSLSGSYLVNANVNIYCGIMNLAVKNREFSPNAMTSDFLSGKKQYITSPFNIKKKSRYYRNNF